MTTLAQHPCPVCNSKEAIVVSNVDGKTQEPLITLECLGCGLGRIDPLPTQEHLRAWYTEQYRQDYKGAINPQMRHVLRAARMALSRWDWVSRRLSNLKTELKTLDIGASSGEFVYLMKSLGFDAVGMEPHLGYGGHAREALHLEVHPGVLQDALSLCKPESQDLLTMFHVLEHVANPLETLEQILGLLKPGGHFLVEVPDATKFCAPHTMFFKAHTLYFCPQVMAMVLRRGGFKVLDQRSHQGNLLFLAQKPSLSSNLHASEAVQNFTTHLSDAQKQRRWPSYIFRELISLSLFTRLFIQIEERQQARRYSGYVQLLDAVYRSAGKTVNP